MFDHFIETADAARGQRVDRTGADAIDADFFWAEIVRQVARAGFERGLGHAHDVVMRHDFFRAIIAHGDDAAAVSHQRRGGARECDERIGAHVVGNAERLTAGVHKFPFERGLGRERHRVEEQMQPAEFFADGFEDFGDFVVLRHIARQDERVRAKRAGEFRDVFLERDRPGT